MTVFICAFHCRLRRVPSVVSSSHTSCGGRFFHVQIDEPLQSLHSAGKQQCHIRVKALTPGRGEVHRAAVVVVADVVALCIETEIASPDHGVFARHCENDTVVTPGVADEIMLPGAGIPAAAGI